jgi:hypothetical protein
MSVLKDKTTGSTVAGSTVTWTYDAAKTWKVANQYLYLAYQANRAGWGIQMYTDNMSATASPQWVETPANTSKPDAPAGLVGEGSVNYIAIPIAWKAFPGGTYGTPTYVTSVTTTTEFRTNYTEPLETAATLNPITHAYDKRLYQASSGSNLYGEYSWLVDKGSENWFDLDSDGEIDTGEIQDIFSNGSDGQTVVNYLGASTSTYDPSGTYIFRNECVSPIYVVLAAKIAAGSIKAIYSTNTLTLELYHQ